MTIQNEKTMKTFCSTLLVALLCLASCSYNGTPKTGRSEIPFEVAQRYFFKNGQTIPTDPKVTTAEDFGRLFGMATVMGSNGRPTEIDFDRQFAVAVVLPVTDRETEIVPLRVELSGDTLHYAYRVTTGEQMSFSIQPLSIILLDKQYQDKPLVLDPQ